MVEVRRRAKEAVLAHLALEGSGRQVRVRLPRGHSGYAGIGDIALHGFGLVPVRAGNLVSDETNGKRDRAGGCRRALSAD